MEQRVLLILRDEGLINLGLMGNSKKTKLRRHYRNLQARRLSAIGRFKQGSLKMLIATDVASRGIDIPSVDLVLNYELPQNSKDYIHRVGRTARAGRAGRAVTLVTQYDVELYQRIEHMLGTQLEQFSAPQEEHIQVLGPSSSWDFCSIASGSASTGRPKNAANSWHWNCPLPCEEGESWKCMACQGPQILNGISLNSRD